MVGYVHYRKESPPPATGRPAQSGFLHQLSGWKSRQLVQIFSNKLQQKLIKMPYQMRRVAAGGGRPSRQLVHICFEAFIVSFFIAGGVNDV